MATYYFDFNGITQGFGTLTKIINNSNPPAGTTSNTGTTGVINLAMGSFSHDYSFGSPITDINTAPGTMTFQGIGVFSANGISYQNLIGDQVWTKTTGNGALNLGGTNKPFIYTAGPAAQPATNGRLIFRNFQIQGTNGFRKLGPSILRLEYGSTFNGSVSIEDGTIEACVSQALSNVTIYMSGGKLCGGGTSPAISFSNPLELNGTMTLGDSVVTAVLDFNNTTAILGPTVLSTLGQGVFFNGKFTGTGALSKGGSGNLWLRGSEDITGPNDYSGAFTLSEGGLFLANFNSGTPYQLNSAASIAINGGNAQICGNTTNTFNNTISGTGDINIRNTSANGIIFTNSSTYTGSPRIYADGAEGGVTSQKWTTKHLGFSTFYYLIGGGLTQDITQTLVYNGTSQSTQNNQLRINEFNVSRAITAVFENASTNNTAVTLNASTVNSASNTSPAQIFRLVATSGSIVHNGAIIESSNGTLRLEKTGSYDVTLNNTNTHVGGTTISSGKLIAAKKGALGAGLVTLNSILQCTDTTTDPAKLATVSALTSNGGRLILGA